MTTNVPAPTFGDRGFVTPQTSEILTGVQADLNQAFGGDLDPALTTPQGQVATSEAAIIADCYGQFVFLANSVDPAFASGRMQDAIGRIYYMTRIPAQATVVTAQCVGANGTVIPIGATAQDQDANQYICIQPGTIPITGTIDLLFQSVVTGPIACPMGFLNTIVGTIPGWDSIDNAVAGVPGYDVETRAAFEFRRGQSVAINAQGTLPAVTAALFAVQNVTDVFVIQNGLSINSGAVVTGSIASNTLTVTAVTSGTLAIGQMIIGSGIADGTYISAFSSGTGGTGTYQINFPQTVGSETLTCSVGGVVLAPHSIYASVYGGLANDIGTALFKSVSNGCDYNGHETVIIQDTESGYNPPLPSYDIKYEIPDSTAIIFNVSMQNNPNVPANAIVLIRNAILAAFYGEDGGSRARIGSLIFASRFYTNIAVLGSWAVIYQLLLGIGSATNTTILMRADQVPTLSASDISVTFT